MTEHKLPSEMTNLYFLGFHERDGALHLWGASSPAGIEYTDEQVIWLWALEQVEEYGGPGEPDRYYAEVLAHGYHVWRGWVELFLDPEYWQRNQQVQFPAHVLEAK